MHPIIPSNSIVAFIDILGFKEIVRANSKSKDNAILNNIQNALSESYNNAVAQGSIALSILGSSNEEKERLVRKLHYRQFSDNLFISFDYDDDKSDYELAVYWVFSMSMHYQRNLLQKNIYVRGGIADGQCYSDTHIIFSDALVKAYEIETKIAKYPRIVIEPKILKCLNKLSKEHIFKRVLKKYIVKDWTGTVFLNPFKMTSSINKMFKETPEMWSLVKKAMDENNFSIPKGSMPDMPDNYLTEFVWEDVRLNLKKYKGVPEVLEKYLWLREFVDWNDRLFSHIEFRYLYR